MKKIQKSGADKLYEDELLIKYTDFYQELLESLDFEKALEQLRDEQKLWA